MNYKSIFIIILSFVMSVFVFFSIDIKKETINKNNQKQELIIYKNLHNENDIEQLNKFNKFKSVKNLNINEIENELLKDLFAKHAKLEENMKKYLSGDKKDTLLKYDIGNIYNGIQNNPLYKNNIFFLKNTIDDNLLKLFFGKDNLLSKHATSLKEDCNLLDNFGIINKDYCLYELSKSYKIDLCADIENKNIKNKCYIYEVKGYDQFDNLEKCITYRNIKNNQFRIIGCIEYFYNNNYEKILNDYKNIIPFLQERFVKIIKKELITRYILVLNDNSICEKYYDNEQEINNCFKLSNELLCEKTYNLDYCGSISNKEKKEILYKRYFKNILGYNSVDKIIKTNFCDFFTDDKYKNDCFFFIGVKTNNKNFCEKIKKEYNKKRCLELIK